MVRKIILTTLLACASLNASAYKNDCVGCHNKLPVSLDKYFYRYLLKYSSERNVKSAMFEYLKNPSQESSVMAEAFISRFGVKEKTKLADEELSEALDRYWEKYKVFGKLQ
mgnify:CR=1 FL=1